MVHTLKYRKHWYYQDLSESSIAAGIRRIEAVTGSAVEDIIYDIQSTLKQAAALLNTTNLIQAVEKTINENADLKKEAENVMQERIKATAEKLLAEKILSTASMFA